MTLFLSYAAADRERAFELAEGLRQAGYPVALDEAMAGDAGWWSGVLAAIQGADAFLLVSSPNTLTAPTCRHEREYAAALGIPTLLVHLDPPTDALPTAPGFGDSGGLTSAGFGGSDSSAEVDFGRADASAAFRLVGALRELPPRPFAVGWQPQPGSPFERINDLVRDVQAAAPDRAAQLRLVERLREAADRGSERVGGGDLPAVQELAAVFRNRTDLNTDTVRRLDEAFRYADAAGATVRPAPVAQDTTGAAAAGRNAGGTSVAGHRAGGGPSWGSPPAGMLTDDDIRRVSFHRPPKGRRGYDEQSVDEFLDLVEADLRARRSVWTVPEQRTSPVVVNLTPADVQAVRFARPAFYRRGYDEEEVDTFLDEIERSLSELDAELSRHGAHIAKHAGGAHSAARSAAQ